MRHKDYCEFQRMAVKILQEGRMRDMQEYIQHGTVTCLQHSFLVAYYSYAFICKLHLPCDEEALVRGALLHDYFLYDWHEKEKWHRLHGFKHPFFALKNARQDFMLTDIEEEIIRKHMWPLTIIPPTCREAWVVNGIDTLSTLVEVLIEYRMFHRLRIRWLYHKVELMNKMMEEVYD